MTIIASPARTWAASHRMLLAVVAFAVALGVAATIAIVMLTSSSTASSSTSTSEPTVEEELTDTQKACELARVVGC